MVYSLPSSCVIHFEVLYDIIRNVIELMLRMIRYFKENGWPTSTLFATPPESDIDRATLIDTLQVC